MNRYSKKKFNRIYTVHVQFQVYDEDHNYVCTEQHWIDYPSLKRAKSCYLSYIEQFKYHNDLGFISYWYLMFASVSLSYYNHEGFLTDGRVIYNRHYKGRK